MSVLTPNGSIHRVVCTQQSGQATIADTTDDLVRSETPRGAEERIDKLLS
jgi:hypothetical protein